MLEGSGSHERLSSLQRAFRRQRSRKLPRIRGKAVGLVVFGALIGSGSVVALDQSESPSSYSTISHAYYANCREAIQAGVAPIHRGQPGYGLHLDRDSDGIACEPYRRR